MDETNPTDLPRRQPGRQFSFDDWKERGLCHNHPTLTTDDFYFESGESVKRGRMSDNSRKARRDHITMLRALCHSCPVLKECSVLAQFEPFGFLAGKTETERNGGRSQNRR